jgi:glycosyltransferase involved in cell wall biosynthesis
MSQDRTVLLYVGVLDRTHDLEPVIRAMGRHRLPGFELHIVGDGARRQEYESLAGDCGTAAVFHGRVAHEEVPVYIATADLCVAPYDPAAFSSGELGYSTMKIPEYLSVGRAVASVPSGRIRSLIANERTGFLFANEGAQWDAFLSSPPDRGRLREMAEAAGRTQLTSWSDTARQYLSLCEARLGA